MKLLRMRIVLAFAKALRVPVNVRKEYWQGHENMKGAEEFLKVPEDIERASRPKPPTPQHE